MARLCASLVSVFVCCFAVVAVVNGAPSSGSGSFVNTPPSFAPASSDKEASMSIPNPSHHMSTWQTAHHDIRNTGRSSMVFTTDTNGSCITPIAGAAAPGETFGESGVTSADASTLFIGTSKNNLLFIDISTGHVTQDIALPGPTGGIEVAPMVYYHTDYSEVLIVGSTNGYIYCLSPQGCEDAGECIIWQTHLNNNSVLAPPRISGISQGNVSLDDGIVFASTTSATSDTDGVLFALNATDGRVMWQHEAGVGIRYVPAVDSLRNGTVFIAFGSYVRALHPLTGDVLAEAKNTDTDPFVSSVTLDLQSYALYVVSESTALHRFILGDPEGPLSILPAWSCYYLPKPAGENCQYYNSSGIIINATQPLPTPAPRLKDGAVTPLLSTPTLSPIEDAVLFVKDDPSGTTGGIVVADMLSGAMDRMFTGAEGVSFGSSQSSIAVDSVGTMFVASDAPDGEATSPVMWSVSLVDPDPVQWITSLGADLNVVGAASPIITSNIQDQHAVIIGIEAEVYQLFAGYSCPSTNPLAQCSGHGECHCDTGLCSCSGCFEGNDCSAPLNCGVNSTTCTAGQCICDLCHVGPRCEHEIDCGPHSSGCSKNACQCTDCYTGPDCSIPKCGNHTDGCNPDGTCKCKPCWSGDDCSIQETCSGFGECDETTGKCECFDCTDGPTCSEPLTCTHGICNPAEGGICDCEGNFVGKHCDQCPICFTGDNCETSCGDHGVCSFQGCDCQEGWGGDFCTQKCDPCKTGPKCDIVSDCSNHGKCNDAVGCVCEPGWGGPFCGTIVPKHSGGGGGNGGAIAGGVIGTVGGLALIGAAFYYRDNIRRFVSVQAAALSTTLSSGRAPATSSSFVPVATSSSYGTNTNAQPPAASSYSSI